MHPNTEIAYRRLSQQLQTDFYRHYNLLHRLNIRERIECMKGSMEATNNYDDCVEAAKRKMEDNMTAFGSKLADINKLDERCLKACGPSQTECEQNCVKSFESIARGMYSDFYRERLQGNKEYESW